MKVYECSICGNLYDEGQADCPFDELEDGWECNICGAPTHAFQQKGGKDSAAPSKAPSQMEKPRVYQCSVCGNCYDEAAAECGFDDLEEGWVCNVCGAPKIAFVCNGEEAKTEALREEVEKQAGNPLSYPAAFARHDDEEEKKMRFIHEAALSGESIIEPMRTRLPVTPWEDILFLGAQLAPFPLEADAEVDTKTVIGKHAKKPMELSMPVYVTHMSFGALSREIKIALAKGSAAVKTAMCSGEGGILPEEMDAAYQYIFEYVPNLYGVTPENLKRASAIEIKIGQGTKPGMGGHLPGNKVTAEIAAVRGKPEGEDILSPSRFAGVDSKEDLKEMVDSLREQSGGRPIGIKIAAGHIEEDMEVIAYAEPDFITVDGRGGATGASPKYLKDASSVPTIFALHRAKKYIEENDLDLVITGGLRTPDDFIKAVAMGADAVAIGSAALMASACQQYRVCHTGKCPTGVMTQDPELRKNLDVEAAAKRLENFLAVTQKELQSFGRVSGHADIHDLSAQDLVTTNSEISGHTDIRHV